MTGTMCPTSLSSRLCHPSPFLPSIVLLPEERHTGSTAVGLSFFTPMVMLVSGARAAQLSAHQANTHSPGNTRTAQLSVCCTNHNHNTSTRTAQLLACWYIHRPPRANVLLAGGGSPHRPTILQRTAHALHNYTCPVGMNTPKPWTATPGRRIPKRTIAEAGTPAKKAKTTNETKQTRLPEEKLEDTPREAELSEGDLEAWASNSEETDDGPGAKAQEQGPAQEIAIYTLTLAHITSHTGKSRYSRAAPQCRLVTGMTTITNVKVQRHTQ